MDEAQQNWAQAKRLLCVRLDSLGDVLMVTPAIRALRGAVAGREITLLTSPSGAAVARLIPEIDEVLVYEARWIKATPPRDDPSPDLAMIEALRQRNFDGAVIFTTFSQSALPAALLCMLAAIPLRLASCHEKPYSLLTTWAPDPEPASGIRHEVRRQLDLVGMVGAHTTDERLSLCVPRAASEHVAGLLRSHAVSDAWAVLHPGSTAASRRYPPELYAEVVQTLTREHGWQIVLTGDASERALAQEIAVVCSERVFDLTGRLDLAQLAALIASAPVLITNNTGPAHIGAAVGTPTVCLYALTNPQHTPWQVSSRVLSFDVPCRWCYSSVCPEGHHRCLRGVPPALVVASALDLSISLAC